MLTRLATDAVDTERMHPDPWRVVVVRAWRHEGRVAAVLLVTDPGTPEPVRYAAVGSVDEACRALGVVLQELTDAPTETTTSD